MSGTFQSQVPDPVGGANFDYNYFGLPANYVASSAQIPPSLGRPLSSGGNVTVNVVESGRCIQAARTSSTCESPNASRSDRRGCRGWWICNPFNSNNVLRMNGAYGRTARHGRARRRLFQAGCSNSGPKCRSETIAGDEGGSAFDMAQARETRPPLL